MILAMVLGTSVASSEEEVWYCFMCAGVKSTKHAHPIEEKEEDDEIDINSVIDDSHGPSRSATHPFE